MVMKISKMILQFFDAYCFNYKQKAAVKRKGGSYKFMFCLETVKKIL